MSIALPINETTQARATKVNPKDFFSDLQALRLSTSEGALAGPKEYLSRLPVGKPSKQEFWRANPDEGMSLITNLFEDKENREFYIIAPSMLGEMMALDVVTPVKLTPTISRQGVLRLIPAKLPSDTGGSASWQDTLLLAVERAKTKWVRIGADMALGAYRIWEAQGALSDPEWPDISLNQMLEIGFKDRIIDNEDHPIFNKLLGRI